MVDNVARATGGANDPSADQNNFHIIHNFFRERFFKHFEAQKATSFLVVERSLYAAIYFLIYPDEGDTYDGPKIAKLHANSVSPTTSVPPR